MFGLHASGFHFVFLMIFLMLFPGCLMHIGKVESATKSSGFTLSVGQTVGPSGMSGGSISVAGSEIVGDLLGQAMTMVPGVSGPNPDTPDINIDINHQDTESDPVSADPGELDPANTSEVKAGQTEPPDPVFRPKSE